LYRRNLAVSVVNVRSTYVEEEREVKGSESAQDCQDAETEPKVSERDNDEGIIKDNDNLR
jgi:hypothetical protein